MERYDGPSFVKLSPTRIVTALACPAKFRYRYIDRLEPRHTSSRFAFGRAVHAAIAFAYARQNVPPEAEEVAGEFARHFAAADREGISYREKETYEDLLEKGRALAALWWDMFRDDVLAAKALSVEAELSHDVGAGLIVHGYPDIIEERDGRLYVGDHKAVKAWGETYEVMVAASVQLTLYGYLAKQKYGRYPDVYYWTVLKKTKEPQVFRYPTTREPAEVDAFAAFAEEVAATVRFWAERGAYVCNASRECASCEFMPLCRGLEGAEEMFKVREDRKAKNENGED